MIIWHNLLFVVNVVSKTLQSKDMQIDVAIDQLKGLLKFLGNYRENGFAEAMTEAKEVAVQMGIEPMFEEKRIVCRKRHKNDVEEVRQSAEESFRVNYFLFIIDQALSSLNDRFEQFQEYEKVFGFLFDLEKLKSTNDDCLMTYCANLETCLRHGEHSDIDGRNLFSELKVMKDVCSKETRKPIEVLNYLKLMGDCFPNAWTAYRILLTIPVTVAS
ncbi:hypothetical protein RHMOL_Rhmol08G0104100 [Rhododendron molle]|uniref:Uncharacterized protein n=1 Tax=Rhododendron molle TaxID=49168 RepID=A0ACC0MLW8_RHOML|nr:hypothetical protein RHMOL_Rhmol08G0104100 [Rhododendron molle]